MCPVQTIDIKTLNATATVLKKVLQASRFDDDDNLQRIALHIVHELHRQNSTMDNFNVHYQRLLNVVSPHAPHYHYPTVMGLGNWGQMGVQHFVQSLRRRFYPPHAYLL